MNQLTLQVNEAPTLDVGSARCDGGLHTKLNKFQLTQHLNAHTFNAFIGRPKSGKSSLIQGLFRSKECLNRVYHDIYLFQPPSSRGSMKKDVFAKLSGDKYYPELTAENLQAVIDKIEPNGENGENACIVLDDMGAYLKDNSVQQLLKQIIYNRRHLRVSIYILAQTYMSIPRDLRKLVSNYIIFRVSKQELHAIFDEVVEGKKGWEDQVSKFVFDRPFNFLFVNVDSQSLFKNWDKIIFPDDREREEGIECQKTPEK